MRTQKKANVFNAKQSYFFVGNGTFSAQARRSYRNAATEHLKPAVAWHVVAGELAQGLRTKRRPVGLSRDHGATIRL
jgi:hypothetical protein